MRTQAEPVLGWRLWWIRGDRLKSWAVDYDWQRGANRATCFARPGPRCPSPPGRNCQCGFWGLWSPSRCLKRARQDGADRFSVMGLISGWGSVAVHGREGFRAELASVVCLFSDRIWIARWGSPMERLLKAIGMRSRSRSSDLSDQSLARRAGLEGVADRYAVPVVSLADAVEIGMLGEFGVGKEQVSEIEAWLDDRLAEPPSGLSNPAL